MTNKSQKILNIQFLDKFILTKDLLPFNDKEIIELDKELTEYEQTLMNPEVEKTLISKNELLASFAISKAERSNLTLAEAKDVYDLVVNNKDYDFIAKKIKLGQKLNQNDHDRLEFFNIVKVFRKLNSQEFQLKQLTPAFIKSLHLELTQGLDIFYDHLGEFESYRSGKWRNNDLIRVGSYLPAPHKIIDKGVRELIKWLKKDFSPTSVAIFHCLLYALHPFSNGNKRVCRILEHILLRTLKINTKNLYSTSYYYHIEKDRYYKHLLYSLERKNLNHFTSFALEAIVLSIISVIKTSIEVQKDNYLNNFEIDDKIKMVLRPLVKREKIQFKTLFKIRGKKVARQTFVTYLQKAHQAKLINRIQVGKAVYYSLNLEVVEKEVLKNWIDLAKKRFDYIPDEIKLAI